MRTVSVYSSSLISASFAAPVVPHTHLPPCNAWGHNGVTNKHASSNTLTVVGVSGVVDAAAAFINYFSDTGNFAPDTAYCNFGVSDTCSCNASSTGENSPVLSFSGFLPKQFWRYCAFERLRLYRTPRAQKYLYAVHPATWMVSLTNRSAIIKSIRNAIANFFY